MVERKNTDEFDFFHFYFCTPIFTYTYIQIARDDYISCGLIMGMSILDHRTKQAVMLTNVAEVLARFLDTRRESLLALTYPDTRVVVLHSGCHLSTYAAIEEQNITNLLVGLVLALGIADLALEVASLAQHKVTDTREVGELSVCLPSDAFVKTDVNYIIYDPPVSTFILTTPLLTAVLISSSVEPDPPWKTRYLDARNPH
jgi:hypothetical protein